VASCSLDDAPRVHYAFWTTVSETKTVKAGTVFVKVDKSQNVTQISTKYNALPSGYSLPQVNSAGTRVETVELGNGRVDEYSEYVL
jgi:hypothetical protein